MEFVSPYIKKVELKDFVLKNKKVACKKDGKAFLFVGVDWCGYCRMVKPEVDKLAQMIGRKHPVYFLDADEAKYRKLVSDLEVKSFPTLFTIDKGTLKKYEGERTYHAFMKQMGV